ncbi:MAG: GGDEF domain-containing protein [Lachnospiraceae bacterium]|nr:GGDEF domain-containing protein [Lachnospiraceae bacterium]
MEQKVTKAKHLSTEQRVKFYQSQYDYYKSFNRGVLIIATVAYLTFFFTDCGIFGRFAHETLLSRLIVIIPLLAFFYLYKQDKSYKVMVTASYLMVHIIIWCTDWATYLLPDREYAGEGMIIMNLIFVCAGFCAPFKYCLIAHCGLIVDILIANIFIQYDNVAMMLMFNIPCVVAVCVMHYTMEKVYLDHYLVTEQLETLVVHDQLTGVYNRNKFKSLSDPVTQELIIPNDIAVTFLIVDLDFFKKVNDQYGHEAGDRVLKAAAQVMSQSVRASDYVIRWGGEEFIVALMGCDLEIGVSIAEKMRVNIENSDNKVCPITASIGVAAYQGGNYHDTIKCADEALYRAKTEGRNRVVVNEG